MKKEIENTKAQMRKGILEYAILLIIAKDKTYASDILRQLKEADLIVVEGTLYPLLSRLKKAEFVAYDWEESPSGPPRKYYSITKRGEEMIKALGETWAILSDAVQSLSKN